MVAKIQGLEDLGAIDSRPVLGRFRNSDLYRLKTGDSLPDIIPAAGSTPTVPTHVQVKHLINTQDGG